MVITKREDVTKQGFCSILWRKRRLRGSLLLELIQFWEVGGRGKVGGVGVGALLSLSGIGREVRWGGRLVEAGRLSTFSAFRMGAYSRWALIRINTVPSVSDQYQLPVKLDQLMRIFSEFSLYYNILFVYYSFVQYHWWHSKYDISCDIWTSFLSCVYSHIPVFDFLIIIFTIIYVICRFSQG